MPRRARPRSPSSAGMCARRGARRLSGGATETAAMPARFPYVPFVPVAPATPVAETTRLALEQELGLALVDQEPHFLGQDAVVLQRRVVVDDVEGHVARPGHPLAVTTEGRQLQVAAPLLARAEHGPLA